MNPISAYGANIAGIQAINGKIGASSRSRPRDSDKRRNDDSDNAEGTDAEPDAPQPHPPGVGLQVDKSA